MHTTRSHSLRVAGLMIVAFCFVMQTLAAIRPGFLLDYSSWHATNIALVEATPRSGFFQVLESWKGDLETGSLVAVPELQPNVGASEIAAYPKAFSEIVRGGANEHIPAQHVGSRMVLFLKKAAETSNDRWEPADLFGEIKASVVWIDGGQLYSFRQLMNPGPSTLVPLDMGLAKMKDRVEEIRRMQLEQARAAAIQDPAARAEALKLYVGSDERDAQRLALSEITMCGPQALPAIREMLSDPALADEGPELIKALADAGGESVAEELNGLLQEQLRFWQATAPNLPLGWWNQDASPYAPLRERYMQTHELVLALERLHYRPASITAVQLASFWRSLPQLNDTTGLSEMVTDCEKLVAGLHAN